MPAPRVGLDITPTALHAVVLRKRGKTHALVRRASMALPPGLVADGEVVDVEGLAAAIRAFWDAEGFKERQVAIGIASPRCIVRSITLARIKNQKELRNTLGFEVVDHLPVPIENIVFDYHTVATFRDDVGTERQRHIVVMAYRDTIERFHEAVVGAGLKVRCIDLAAFALMRSGIRSAETAALVEAYGAEAAVAVCEIGESSTNLVIATGGSCELNRMIEFGANRFTHTLMEQFGWSEADSDRVRFDAGIMPPGGFEAPGDPYAESRQVNQYVADQLAAELRASFDYFLHAEGGIRVVRLVICGIGSLLRGIDQRLSMDLGVPVDVLDLAPHLDSASRDILDASQVQYGTAFGLALEDAA
jgi:type IV pilus assembly protein PilM